MIKYKQGNLVEAFTSNEVDIIAHQANCFCTMNSGIAKEIKNKYPQSFEADCKTVKGDKGKLGSMSYSVVNDNKYIYNLYGQYNYGRDKQYTDYSSLRSAIRSMVLHIRLNNNQHLKVGIPKLGCGLAGGDWDVVRKIINEEMKELDVTVYVLTIK